MNQDRNHHPDGWIERARAQACALRETVRDHPDLCELIDVFLIDLGTKTSQQSPPPETEP